MRFIKLKKLFASLVFLLISALVCLAQTSSKPKPAQTPVNIAGNTQTAIKSSPAYAEILLRKTELESTLDDLTVQFTEEYPKVKETRFELGALRKELDRILAVNDASKLTQGLGKLILRKVELETDLWSLLQKYGEEFDDVKRARRKVGAFEKAIKEILP
ncbi:MAG TPA: hypothetical protein VF599_11300 [Pyrinomonadaceae bacterium]|jgi:uncharacterized protein involved in exopolysaccharide biosynthesis